MALVAKKCRHKTCLQRTIKKKEKSGEFTLPSKSKQTRQRKPRTPGENATGIATTVVKGGNNRISGQKRKEYRPKATALPCTIVDVIPSANVPVGALMAATVAQTTVDGGENQVANLDSSSNKKHKASPRSMDPVAAA
jgi:hypothetical protein